MNKIFLSLFLGMLLLNPMVLADDVNTSIEIQGDYPLQLGSLGITIFIFALALAGVRILFDVMYLDFDSVGDLVTISFHFLISFIFIALVITVVFGG